MVLFLFPLGLCTCLKTLSLEQLGQGNVRGGAAGRKKRHEVLDRMARTGVGLSPGPRNDWAWFIEAWDEKMRLRYKADWGSTFAEWIQGVLGKIEEEGARNAFSAFVHDETRRCLNDAPVLQVP